MKLLNIDANPKTVKGQKKGYLTGILYLAPADLSGYNVCPMSTEGCRAACLNTAGRGATNSVQKARINKTQYFYFERKKFLSQLVQEIHSLKVKAKKVGLIPVVRLNGTSDIVWEAIWIQGDLNIFEMFPEVQFYDYTKRYNRKNIPANYHLTFSLAEDNDKHAYEAFKNGMNVAAVFRDKETVSYFEHFGFPLGENNVPVFNGDESDLRFLDPKNHIVALYAKGRAKKDTTGFVKD